MEEDASRNSINLGDQGVYLTSTETTPLQRDKGQDEGLRYIITTFTVVTVILSIALAVTLNQGSSQAGFNSEVVSDRLLCSNVGKELFKTGGSAVDVAIAVSICLGVVLPHLTGIGGNGLILVYNQKLTQPLLCLDSWTPGNVALPKLILALHLVHEKLGKKPWQKIIEPSIRLAREGFPVAESLIQSKDHLNGAASPNLVSWLSTLKVGENTTSSKIAETLTTIQNEGPYALYKGSLSGDLKEHYGTKLLSDLSLNENPCLESIVEGFRIVSSGKGSGGLFLHSALSQGNITHNSSVYHLLEYFEGKSELGWPFPSGVVVVASDDQENYVSIVSGLGSVLGSQTLSVNGYIFGRNLNVQNSSTLGSIGAAFVASDASSRCKKRIITGGVDVRDLLEVVPGLLWGSADVQTVVEGPRTRFGEHGLLAELSHAPSFPFPLPPAPLPYPTINVIEKFADLVTPYSDSRSGL